MPALTLQAVERVGSPPRHSAGPAGMPHGLRDPLGEAHRDPCLFTSRLSGIRPARLDLRSRARRSEEVARGCHRQGSNLKEC
jgi:hypothetical protein